MSEDDKIVRLIARRENGEDKTVGEEDVPVFLRALAHVVAAGPRRASNDGARYAAQLTCILRTVYMLIRTRTVRSAYAWMS
jgi:hypothetical protein